MHLATGWGRDRTARTLKVHRTTLWRWEQDPEFQAELARHQRLVQQGAANRVLAAVDIAMDVYAEIAEDKTIDPKVRVLAADRMMAAAQGLGHVPATDDEDDLSLVTIRAELDAIAEARRIAGPVIDLPVKPEAK